MFLNQTNWVVNTIKQLGLLIQSNNNSMGKYHGCIPMVIEGPKPIKENEKRIRLLDALMRN